MISLAGNQSPEFSNNVSVIILIHNNRAIIRRCLETILRHGKRYIKEVIVVDNASSDGGADYVEELFPDVKVLRNPKNGCSSGRNLGADVASGKYLAFFDSDQWLTSGWCFEEALSILQSNADVGAVSWGAGWFESVDPSKGGRIVDDFPNRALESSDAFTYWRTDVAYLATSGLFLPRTVFNATTKFDNHFDPTCFEDTDLSFQIKRLGLKLAYRDMTGIRHEPHQTTRANKGDVKYWQLYARNADYFRSKWESFPEFFLTCPRQFLRSERAI